MLAQVFRLQNRLASRAESSSNHNHSVELGWAIDSTEKAADVAGKGNQKHGGKFYDHASRG